MEGEEDETTPDTLDFNGAWVKNQDKITSRKSLVICGITRGGTSFAASAFGRLGVPFSRPGEPNIGARYEHRELRTAFVAKDGATIRRVAGDFSEKFPVWAWKLPAIQRDFEFVADCVPNPHFVLIFKEPVSVAARKTDLKGKDTLRALKQVLFVYDRLTQFALETNLPVLLISYDRALNKLGKFLPEAAAFAGVTGYDIEEAVSGIGADGKRYFRGKSKESPGTPPAVPERTKIPQDAIKAKSAKAAKKRMGPFDFL